MPQKRSAASSTLSFMVFIAALKGLAHLPASGWHIIGIAVAVLAVAWLALMVAGRVHDHLHPSTYQPTGQPIRLGK